MDTIRARIEGLDWSAIERSLWAHGHAKTPPVLTAEECAGLVALYDDAGRFRSRIEMARYRFGEGEYNYFAAPLPPLVQVVIHLAAAQEDAAHLARIGDFVVPQDALEPALREFRQRGHGLRMPQQALGR